MLEAVEDKDAKSKSLTSQPTMNKPFTPKSKMTSHVAANIEKGSVSKGKFTSLYKSKPTKCLLCQKEHFFMLCSDYKIKTPLREKSLYKKIRDALITWESTLVQSATRTNVAKLAMGNTTPHCIMKTFPLPPLVLRMLPTTLLQRLAKSLFTVN